MINFFSMNGYGPYIWAAYSITIFVLLLIFFLNWNFTKKTEMKLKKLTEDNNPKIESGGDEAQT